MQSVENRTAQEWESVIANLKAKTQTHETEIRHLTVERDSLALDAELGIDGAGRRLQKLTADIIAKQQAIGNLHTAITQAEDHLTAAREVETQSAEEQRQRQLRANMEQYFQAIRGIDDTLRLLASRFVTARQILDRAESLMTPEECAPMRQLRSPFGPTLAAAHFGLGEFIALGPQASYTIHRQPLSKFVEGFVEHWVSTNDINPDGEGGPDQ